MMRACLVCAGIAGTQETTAEFATTIVLALFGRYDYASVRAALCARHSKLLAGFESRTYDVVLDQIAAAHAARDRGRGN